MKQLLCLALAGSCGALLRYGIIRLFPASNSLPWATWTVNILGAFAAGILAGLAGKILPKPDFWLPVIMAGFLGAFTTFSTFALESSRLLLSNRLWLFAVNVLLMNFCGIAAAAGGLLLAGHLK